MPTRVLTPYWADGIQRLKVVPQRTFPRPLLRSRAMAPALTSAPRARLRGVASHLLGPLPRRAAMQKPAPGTVPAALSGTNHAVRCLAQLRAKPAPIEKYIYLAQLKAADEHMFYHLCLGNMSVRPRVPHLLPLGAR